MTIQQQCSHRNAPTAWKFSNFQRTGDSGIVSDNHLGRYLKESLSGTSDLLLHKRRLRAWLLNHLHLLADCGQEARSITLIGELFDSRQVPEMLPGAGRISSSFIRHHVARGNAYPGSSPAQIIRFVTRHKELSAKLGKGTWTDTWLELDEEGVVHLKFAITWTKCALEVAAAA